MTIVAKGLDAIRRIRSGVGSRFRNVYYKSLGVEIHGNVWMRRVSIPRNFNEIFLANNVALEEGVTLLAVGEPRRSKKIAIGENTCINRHAFIEASHQIRIGRNVGVGPRCYITDHDKGPEPVMLKGDQARAAAPTVISDGVWLGAGCIVLKGVTIGKNTIVGAGSVVVHDPRAARPKSFVNADVSAATAVSNRVTRVTGGASDPMSLSGEQFD